MRRKKSVNFENNQSKNINQPGGEKIKGRNKEKERELYQTIG